MRGRMRAAWACSWSKPLANNAARRNGAQTTWGGEKGSLGERHKGVSDDGGSAGLGARGCTGSMQARLRRVSKSTWLHPEGHEEPPEDLAWRARV